MSSVVKKNTTERDLTTEITETQRIWTRKYLKNTATWPPCPLWSKNDRRKEIESKVPIIDYPTNSDTVLFGGVEMLAVQKIEKKILSLSPEEFSDLRSWFYSQDNMRWDKQLEQDSLAGSLDFLVQEAKSEKQSGRLRHI